MHPKTGGKGRINDLAIRYVAKLSGKGVTTVQRVKRLLKSTIIAIILLILRSFQRKGLCDSGLKAKSTTFVRNITTIRLRSQIVILIINIEYESYKFCY